MPMQLPRTWTQSAYPVAKQREALTYVGWDGIAHVTCRSPGAVQKMAERGTVCLATGPIINNRPTWPLLTILAWAYRNGLLNHPDTGAKLPLWDEGRIAALKVPESATTSVLDLHYAGRLEHLSDPCGTQFP